MGKEDFYNQIQEIENCGRDLEAELDKKSLESQVAELKCKLLEAENRLLKGDLSGLQPWEVVEWFETLVRYDHYCPMECHCYDKIPKGLTKRDLEEELIRRLMGPIT